MVFVYSAWIKLQPLPYYYYYTCCQEKERRDEATSLQRPSWSKDAVVYGCLATNHHFQDLYNFRLARFIFDPPTEKSFRANDHDNWLIGLQEGDLSELLVGIYSE